MIYEFRITLINVGMPVWRNVQIHSEESMYDLHLLIQHAFDWTDTHLHSFFVNRRDGNQIDRVEIAPKYSEQLDSNDSYEKYIENNEIIADWFIKIKDKMSYIYDFGDDWEHEIVLTKILDQEKDVLYPRCIDAKNLTPPEDSRGEVIMGEVDLECEGTDSLIADINDEIRFMKMTAAEIDEDYWPKTLAKAKEFQKLKPWEIMTDEHIFALEDPDTGEFLFCSVLGQGGEIYGLAVYIGIDGFLSLVDSFADVKSSEEIMRHQHSLLLSFENRTDLANEEYEFIKAYDVAFRGKKAWPSLMSFKPGFYPWKMDDEEARLMYLALKETIKTFDRIKDGVKLPHMSVDGELLVKISGDDMEDPFEETIMEIDEIIEELSFMEFIGYYTPTELEIKRAMRNAKKRLNITLEYKATYLNIPVQETPEERPIFPAIILVADHNEGTIYHHNIYAEGINSQLVQNELLNIFSNLGGTPMKILTDYRTFSYLTPLVDQLDVSIELVEDLPAIGELFDEMQEAIEQELED